MVTNQIAFSKEGLDVLYMALHSYILEVEEGRAKLNDIGRARLEKAIELRETVKELRLNQ